MSGACSSQFALLQRIHGDMAARSLAAMTAATDRADAIRQQVTTTAPGEYTQTWESPAQLRECSEAHKAADMAQQSFMQAVMYQQRATCRAVVQAAWVSLRGRVARAVVTYREQLRDLAALVVPANENAPPLLARRSVLSLCSASNAPGLSCVPMTWQVPPN